MRCCVFVRSHGGPQLLMLGSELRNRFRVFALQFAPYPR